MSGLGCFAFERASEAEHSALGLSGARLLHFSRENPSDLVKNALF